MLRNKICDIFHKVQQSTSCHQKYQRILLNLYNTSSFEDFEIEFMRCIETLFYQDITHKNSHVEKSVEFAATFISQIVELSEKETQTQEENVNPFLNTIIRNVLEYHDLENVAARYRSCQFINLLLNNVGDDVEIYANIWDDIQDAMLERIKDVKPIIRMQAIKALVRLQTPTDIECPVINAFLDRCYDTSAMVRKQVVELIAPSAVTISKIIERVRDSDHTVRLAAYRKCALIGPKLLRIADRQSILNSGFNETHELVKNCFINEILPKWLNAYNGDYLQLLTALKLDAYEEDIKQTEFLCRKLLEAFFNSQQLSLIIEYLPVENRLIPLEKLNHETALYWSILSGYLRKSDTTEDYLDEILPELIHFCAYIETYYKEKLKQKLRDWEYFEHQYILSQLFQMAGKYDLGDEVGRRMLHKLIVDILTQAPLDNHVLCEIISILEKLNPVFDSLTIDICHILSEIREPLVPQEPTEEALRQYNFQLAQFRVKINVLNEENEEAVKRRDYKTAAANKIQITELNKQMEDLKVQFETEKVMVKSTQSDSETTCRCLNILIAVLSRPTLKTLTTSLRGFKDEFILPLIGNSNNNMEISWRLYKCMVLYCLLDKQLTREHMKFICTPIIVYRLVQQYDKSTILACVAGISDLLHLFGTDIFGEKLDNTTNGGTSKPLNGTRRLYRISNIGDADDIDCNSITCKDIIDIMSDMLDDENEEIREQAGRALCELVMSKIAVSPTLISRMILTWLNPLNEKNSQKLQQLLGNTFVYFAQHVKGSEEVLEQMVIPVLTSIGNAPRLSPLADIDIDNAIRFLAAITSIEKPNIFINTHKNLAFALCYKISSKPKDNCVPLYIKMLLSLDLFIEDIAVIEELISQVDLLIDDIVDKLPRKNVEKFGSNLRKLLAERIENQAKAPIESILQSEATAGGASLLSASEANVVTNENSNTQHESCNSIVESSVNLKNDTMEENVNNVENLKLNEMPVKRRKNRVRRSARLSQKSNNSDETVLHTIIEDSYEIQSLEDEDIIIETPTTGSSLNSTTSSEGKKAGRRIRKIIVSDTSSDTECPQQKGVRKSKRKRRQHIT